jgi:hypothetical protein
MDVRDADAAELLRELVAELRSLREEAARQTALLEELLRKVDSLERSQYG